MHIQTPAFVVDAEALARNAAILADVKARTGCRILLALKAFSMPAAAPCFNGAPDGTCASSVHEARLGIERFGGETHAFAAAFTRGQMQALIDLGTGHITFNSLAQYTQFRQLPGNERVTCGLRINPLHSEGEVELYDPCAPKSRLGITRQALGPNLPQGITGLHCHNLCEQNAEPFVRTLAAIEAQFGDLLPKITWFNFGGGHHITRPDYNRDLLCQTLTDFQRRHPRITCYLEPGEAWVLNAGTLAATVIDIVENDGSIAILDISCACHTPDVMETHYRPRVFRQPGWTGASTPAPHAERGLPHGEAPHLYRLAGPSCLAGDIIGDYSFATPLRPGDRLIFEDMALYTMVKTNTFNGINLPDIILRRPPADCQLIRTFGYDDFISRI